MIIPSIDLMNGQAVQLIGGKEHALDAGDPLPIMRKFRLAGDVAVIDLDRALGRGSNEAQIKELIKLGRTRVGGGIRSVSQAIDWLDQGADKVILGTAAVPSVLEQLPCERVIAALDAVDGELVVEGWQTRTGERIEDRLKLVKDLISGVMITFVEREGRLGGVDLERIRALRDLAAPLPLTIAGGVTTIQELAALDELGVDAQVGMALYTNKLSLAEGIAAPLLAKQAGNEFNSDAAIWPTVVVNEQGVALGLCWSSKNSLEAAVNAQAGIYQSRKRGLWVKGLTSGATQELLAISLDCDRDTLRFTVKQTAPGFCHLNTLTCWGENPNSLFRLENLIQSRLVSAPEGSYTKRLVNDSGLLAAKIEEEARELVEAREKKHISEEAADLLYFTLVYLAKNGCALSEIEEVLNRRTKKVTRRPGNAKMKSG